jgi:5-(carboxyamino)imidazole ribonucleotide mutase
MASSLPIVPGYPGSPGSPSSSETPETVESLCAVGIIMGSVSDLQFMRPAIDVLDAFEIKHEVNIVSAHRTPEIMMEYGKTAHTRGISVIIAGAGGAAHLPGMVASLTHLPVIGVPIKSSNSIDGWDSVLSILQMPGGVPVATVALNGAKNAALLAARILGVGNSDIAKKLVEYRETIKNSVIETNKNINATLQNHITTI